MNVIITLVIVLLVLFAGMATYNRLVRLRKGVQKAWRQLAAPLKRRHELAASLVERMSGAAAIDPGALDTVIAARNAAVAATGPVDGAARERALSQSLARLAGLLDGDPALGNDEHLRALRDRLSSTEAEVAAASRAYNQIATSYNTAATVIPGNMIAGLGNFPRAELFEPRTP